MLLHLIGNGGETLQVVAFRAMVNILTRVQQESVDEAERNIFLVNYVDYSFDDFGGRQPPVYPSLSTVWGSLARSKGTYVEGIKEEVVLSPGHASSFIVAGEEHRHVGSNNFNLFSSRSHTIFTLVAKYLVPTIRSIPANGSTKPTCIHLLTGIKTYSKIF